MVTTGKEIAYRKAIGLQVKRQLIALKRSQEEAARLAKVTPNQLGDVVQGRTCYTIDTLTKIVAANDLNLEFSLRIFNEY